MIRAKASFLDRKNGTEDNVTGGRRRKEIRVRRPFLSVSIGLLQEEEGEKRVVCVETSRDGSKRVYREGRSRDSFVIEEDEMTHKRRLDNVIADYLLPQGYPESVAPQYQKYMMWRGIQYFFGGALSVLTTRSLLKSLGVANKNSGEAAAAINWVVKDGAGRMGRFLFARWGRSLDCELKQFRLAGDILMETGASLELVTALSPKLFLPLACTANLAKNLAAVAASSTRAPIYRTFAKANNMADVTAKGESVANLADVFGTAFGIILAKAKFPTVPTFLSLSVGYLIASRKEVDSVELPYFNRARLSYATRKFFETGTPPGIEDGNTNEPLLPWSDPSYSRVVLGATVKEACESPRCLEKASLKFSKTDYILNYRSDTKKAYVMLRKKATSETSFRGTFAAQLFLHILKGGDLHLPQRSRVRKDFTETRKQMRCKETAPDAIMSFVSKHGDDIFKTFETQVTQLGWKTKMTMLNTKDTRIVQL
jgi:hypothetical protein